MVKYYCNLLRRFMIISWCKIRAFNFEFLMMFVHLLFNFSFILIFWNVLLRHIHTFGDWTFPELALFSGVTFLGESLGGIFFGFRDLPQRILNGDLDKFLVRPINTLFAVLFERVSIVYFLEQFIASILLIWIIIANYSITVRFDGLLMGTMTLMLGVVIYNLIYGIVTFLAFWVGRVGVFRAIIFGLIEAKQYPLSIFPANVRFFLTFIIPTALLSYFPTIMILGKSRVRLAFFMEISVLFILVIFVFQWVWKKGLARYEANGG